MTKYIDKLNGSNSSFLQDSYCWTFVSVPNLDPRVLKNSFKIKLVLFSLSWNVFRILDGEFLDFLY